jgi:hypothetical protein
LNHGAGIDAVTSDGKTPLMLAVCMEECTQVNSENDTALVLLERNADVHAYEHKQRDALYYAALHMTLPVVFVLLCCGADASNVKIDAFVTQARVDGCIEEYKSMHAYIDQCHRALMHILSRHVHVDRRLGIDQAGLYQEPLDRTLEYLGLSMNADQVVNTSIDGTTRTRALIPGLHRSARHWYNKHELWQQWREQFQAWHNALTN